VTVLKIFLMEMKNGDCSEDLSDGDEEW